MTAIVATSCNYAGSSDPTPAPVPAPRSVSVTWMQTAGDDTFLSEQYFIPTAPLDVKDLKGNDCKLYYYDFELANDDKYITNDLSYTILYNWKDGSVNPGVHFEPTSDGSNCEVFLNISNVKEYKDLLSNNVYKTQFEAGGVTYWISGTPSKLEVGTNCILNIRDGLMYKDAATVIVPNGGTLTVDDNDTDIPENGQVKCHKLVFEDETVYLITGFAPN